MIKGRNMADFKNSRPSAQIDNMGELKKLLQNVGDSYNDFVMGMMNYADFNADREERLIGYLKNNPEALSSDIIEFVSKQADFYEDASEDADGLEEIA